MGLVLYDQTVARNIRYSLNIQNRVVVFTNGCFDILHRGHIEFLEKARGLGDYLIVGLNSDDSVKRLKGKERPLVYFADRAFILSRLSSVDLVVQFCEDTPEQIIDTLIPDVLVKGADWHIGNIVGREIVEKCGGKVITIPLLDGLSTTNLIKTVLDRFQNHKTKEDK